MDNSEDHVEDVGSEETELIIEPSFPKDILTIHHSFGYDCKRLFNICLIDDDTLVFASGNLIHYFSISKAEVTFRETQFGAGIGFITKNEHIDFQGLLTVAENGAQPTVFIYEYPSHNVHIKLEGAAKAMFTCGSYNASGELFASQAGYPDFMLTIWRWQKAEIILRSKAFQNDVLHVHFSVFNPILLVTCGLSHIKFWKMANTFTGLKLQGDLGRFGKTDFSDIYAIYMLPDENIISGCEWGNMLLWEAGLIKFEICRKGRKPCHTKPISRITMENGEVTTVGMDGYVRIWFWETVDLADPPDDDRFVEIDPIYEFKIGNCEIRGLQKIKPFDDGDFAYYAQDGNGGFWYCDINTDDIPNEPRKIYSCHGGKVVAAQASPTSTLLMTLGEDGKIFVYDYAAKKTLLEKQFNSIGVDLIWLSTKISSNAMEMVAAFEDGIIRQLLLDSSNSKRSELHLVNAIKAHTAKITVIGTSPQYQILISGSEDKTIFIYRITDKVEGLVNVQPLGFIRLDSVPNSISWKSPNNTIVLIGSKTGEVYEYNLPIKVTEEQVFLSYDLTNNDHLMATKFVSVKSRIRRDIRRAQIKKRKELKRQRKLDEVEKLKAANPGLQIDMESALADSEPEEEEEPLHIPAKPNPILWLRQTTRNTIWVSMGGYDAGYIYELQFDAPEPVRCTIIADGDDCEIYSYFTVDKFLIFGLGNGKLRINHINVTDFTDLREYRLYSMHDALKGKIPQMIASFDGQHLFSIGYDGNVFAYNWSGVKVPRSSLVPVGAVTKPKHFYDIDDPEHPSLEQEKIYAEIKRQEEAAAEHDRNILKRINELQVKFNEIVRQNQQLPEHIQIPHRDMLLDDRITKQIADELQAELDDVREDLAYDLEKAQLTKTKLYDHFMKNLDHIPILLRGVSKNIRIYTFRVEKLGEEFEKIKEEIEERLRLEAAKRGVIKQTLADEKEDVTPEPGVESFFFGRDPDRIIPRFSKKMLRLLKRYRSRQLSEIERIYNWDKLESARPDPNKNHPDDDRQIEEAARNLGDYKLKIGHDYQPSVNETLTHKYIEVVNSRERIVHIMEVLNNKVFAMRKQKKDLYEYIAKKRKRLEVLHELIPKKNHNYLPNIPEIPMDDEYPELNLIERCKPGCGIEISDILYLEKTIKDMLPKPLSQSEPVAKMSKQEIHERQKYYSLRIQDVEYLPEPDKLIEELENMPQVYEATHTQGVDGGPSPWLTEKRCRWLLDLINEQEGIIFSVSDRINKFDEDLKEMIFTRYVAKFELEYMLSYMIVLNQELYILRDSEEIENRLLLNADNAMNTRNEMQVNINSSNRLIDEGRRTCDKLNEQIVNLQMKFMSTCKGHKFFDFLRRIFKKKWKPPKPPKKDDESSESSSEDETSSEDENADAKSVDSLDMTTIRLDESTCPSGLERAIYDLAFKLRSERHALERSLLEQQKLIELRRQDVAEMQKKMKYHEEVYAQEKRTLLDFRLKRQQELNKVNVSVILNMAQIQHFRPGEDYRDLSNAVLFDARRLTSLKERVEQLNVETLETKRVHRINIVHLRRMNADITFMRYETTRLEEQIKDEMMKKLGMIIDLDELEEEVLRKYVFELETSAEDELKLIDKEISQKKLELGVLQEELIHETKVGTEKLNVLAVLQEEKNFLDEILAMQEKCYDKWFKPNAVNFDPDIEKLSLIDKHQKEQIKCLEREICTLRMKSKPLQIEYDFKETGVTQEVLPNDEANICPALFAADAYDIRMEPDEFIMERVEKLVVKCFNKSFGAVMPKENVRKYGQKVARYLGQAAYSFEGKITDRIMDCITENLQQIVPKKYLIHLSSTDLVKLVNEILAVFDYEHSEVNTIDVVSGIYHNAMDSLVDAEDKLNKTQHILEHMFKELIEVLPYEEFLRDHTLHAIVNILLREPLINAKCISIENLVDTIVSYARENLLDGITAVPIRRLAENIKNDLLNRRKSSVTPTCSVVSVGSVSIATKKKN